MSLSHRHIQSGNTGRALISVGPTSDDAGWELCTDNRFDPTMNQLDDIIDVSFISKQHINIDRAILNGVLWALASSTKAPEQRRQKKTMSNVYIIAYSLARFLPLLDLNLCAIVFLSLAFLFWWRDLAQGAAGAGKIDANLMFVYNLRRPCRRLLHCLQH